MTVGIVVVSHSPQLGEAAVALALEMVPGRQPPIIVAAGTADGGTGTDAARVADAVAAADDGDGVVIITDLGSAVLSAELAIELLAGAVHEVRIAAAPFVEGLLAAVVRAAGGADVDEVQSEAALSISAKVEHLGGPGLIAPAAEEEEAVPDAVTHAVLVNDAGLHARPAAQLARVAAEFDARLMISVIGKEAVAAVSPVGLTALGARQGDSLSITGTGAHAQRGVTALAALVSDGFGELDERAQAAPAVKYVRGDGLGVSPGRVIGTAVVMPAPPSAPRARKALPEAARAAEVARLHSAVQSVIAGLRRTAADGPAGDILSASASMAADPAVLAKIENLIRTEGLQAEQASWRVLSRTGEQLRRSGGRAAERVADILDLRDRTLAELRGEPQPGVPEAETPFVLVAGDLSPVDTAGLDPQRCLAIVTAEGGPTSHTSILARAMGIPAVVGAPIAAEVHDGQTLLVDGGTGEVIIDPSPEDRATAHERVAAPARLERAGATADGHRVHLLANIGSPEDAAVAKDAGAEGVGLFRTEFCFLDRREAPGIEEQAKAYRAVFENFPGQRVVVRTLDAGSDKPLPFLTVPEPNPALGVRGIRTAVAHPQILDDQLTAIAKAAHACAAEVWVMAPMVATVAEAADFAGRVRSAGLRSAGIMIETPAAALQAEQMLAQVDFASIGTNDLTQYTLAADRLLGSLGRLGDPWQPTVLRLIRMTGESALAASAPLGVCGEAAADPLLAVVLVGLGVTSLSMSVAAIPAVGEMLAGVDRATCITAAQAAVQAIDSSAARSAVQEVLTASAR